MQTCIFMEKRIFITDLKSTIQQKIARHAYSILKKAKNSPINYRTVIKLPIII